MVADYPMQSHSNSVKRSAANKRTLTAMMSHVAFAGADPDERDGSRESDSPFERTNRQAARKMLTIQPRQHPSSRHAS
jgi:hypothetical protein